LAQINLGTTKTNIVFSKTYWINEEKIGEQKIGTMARPRGNDWLDDEIKGLKNRKIDCLVSLLERSEEFELGLQNEKEICANWEIEFINFPIQDVTTPKNKNLNYTQATANLPPPWPHSLRADIALAFRQMNQSIVVLDDDPTGTQTLHDVPIITSWSEEAIAKEFLAETPLFFILTNSRSLTEGETIELHKTVSQNLAKAAKKTEREFIIISRSDSTLRGHYPAEVETLQQYIYESEIIKIIIPAFFEGNRLTLNDTHYIKEGDELLPVAESKYAQDKYFGYEASNLKAWVEEKSKGKIKATEVFSIPIEMIRKEGPTTVAQFLKTMPADALVIINALNYRDLEVFVRGYWQSGCKALFRTAASIVPVLIGVEKKPLLDEAQLQLQKEQGALVIVGSYVEKTTLQLNQLKANCTFSIFEIDVNTLLGSSDVSVWAEEMGAKINVEINAGRDVLVYTSRALVSSKEKEENLKIGHRVSQGLIQLASAIKAPPRFILAKGGITSSDIATKALGIKRAKVIGQILPGVPVWETQNESKFPQIPYIVFPGNVGSDMALVEVMRKLSKRNQL